MRDNQLGSTRMLMVVLAAKKGAHGTQRKATAAQPEGGSGRPPWP